MKYLITESQLDKVIFKYLDYQDFIRIERKDKIYFVNSENDEYSDSLIIHYRNGDCVMSFELINEIATFFSMEFDSSKYVIARWIENTLGRRVKEIIIR
jgi:type IV secretory pathway VirB9-like protein